MKRIIYSLPIIPVYIYGITILTQYGYNSYFGIPQSYIQVSIVQNYIHFYQLFKLLVMVANAMSLWMGSTVVLGFIAILLSYHFDYFWMWTIRICGMLFLAYALYNSYHFGQYVAQHTSDFYVPMDECPLHIDHARYIISNFYQDKAILVAIDENNVLKGEMMLKNLSDLGCGYVKKNIGLIKQN